MPVVKGGVWTNIEDEILKASVSKYGLNQWARVSSLLARKTPKQCKARWSEWLDPGIRKIEWSNEEDEKLLHLAKLMPTQWRTIAPIVGRTATQCLERYQKLLDEAEAKENDELGLGGPDGGEAAPPNADDVRRLRPGELDPDPESKPARPDTIDLDEDEKEMLSEARARLANTQGKKAKRKARERQLEESRRLAVLQKRRELKNAGINIKIVTRKPGQMDYNADIPFEKAPAPGFYDTAEEEIRNDRQKEMFDPRKQQLANKRKGDGDEDGDDRKRRKNDKNAPAQALAAAAKAGQMQKIREAERSSKRRSLVLPSPQVDDRELEDIVKMGMAGEMAQRVANNNENEATRSLIGNYSGIVGGTPIRTPRAPQEQDRVANEIRNARARTETQSALLGGENAPLYEGADTTGFDGTVPTKQLSSTPNPMATPFRQINGVAATPSRSGLLPGNTPLRTPRDNFRLNDQTPSGFPAAGETPKEMRRRQSAVKNTLRSRLAALPKPRETEWELELPEEQQENTVAVSGGVEDAAIRDQRNLALRQEAEQADFKRQSQVIQRSLPRLPSLNMETMLVEARNIEALAKRLIAIESVQLMANDAQKHGGTKLQGTPDDLQAFRDDELDRAKAEIAHELGHAGDQSNGQDSVESRLTVKLDNASKVLGLQDYGAHDSVESLTLAFEGVSESLTSHATSSAAVEKRLAVVLGGYQVRAKKIRQKTAEAAAALETTKRDLNTKRDIYAAEGAALAGRLEGLRAEVEAVMRRERGAQQLWKDRSDELNAL